MSTTAITILGTGVWGSALGTLAQANHHTVTAWSRRGPLTLTQSLAQAQVLVVAISMKGIPDLAAQLQQLKLPTSTIIVSATKGLDPATLRTPSQIWQATFPNNPVLVLSGPNLSKEIEQRLPAATVVAGPNQAAVETVQQLFSSDCFRVYTNPDQLGTELGGTLKNVIAISVGVCEGLKLGTNARAALITRALPEMIRVGTHLGGQAETFFGLSGLGDLLATCTSPLSRNYQVGYQLAQGKSLPEILDQLHGTAEGVNTTNVLVDLANREGIPIPIARQVHRLLKGRITPQEALESLMDRELKPEACDLL
ncbi:NAD(P)H-dependent glycerol-3-phosphate dehydrogenase [Acaryochloris marina]|uniref:Glycerol-3-phosphate dehydrogenase [NAD(P)+] n=1 Tax=Acaryochloris marina (strain MBIC 11017) TaxID=329726 RepID=GPDA_ACAM1|nr:NAD(P)H-dependent glycerol-3-phosphate dehydrogenase [Acaryochloris marina]B0C2F0.1 RecName: Full=Glycerol-3-phosphate dehydrogenase [NAD(P)+]; AltName: Full=NAD(P)H-dependent glycerol-3-phosphate dehydrogenase [Acaryochloris marina MBIC11017]ABW29740.1 NAD-dependent glycerol-3-phosphate dehydrogenase [Acaryochloris marina MBIC11017]BDM78634.1 glycerol-3-phosphate dehydrogenase [NAD(P)+] [Acaryochloris marina MBIC10699]